MTAAVITLAIALALVGGALVYVSKKFSDALADERSSIGIALESGKAQLVVERELAKTVVERDAALKKASEQELAAAKCLRSLASATATIQDLATKEGANAVTAIRAAASPDDALAVLRDLMSAPLPGLLAARTPTGDRTAAAHAALAAVAGAVSPPAATDGPRTTDPQP